MRPTLVCIALAVATAAAAQPVTGTGQLAGRGVLAVRHCGRDPGAADAVVSVAADGTWTAVNPEVAYSGTSAPLDARGRKLDLTFDASSLADFVAGLAADASELCEGPVSATAADKRRFTLGLNRRKTRAKVVLRYRLTGTGPGGPGTANYRLKLVGPWTSGG